MRIVKDKEVNTGEVLFNLNRSNPIAVQILSGLPSDNNNTINSEEPNFFRYLSALSQDAQALPKLRYQAGQLVFYYYDKPQFVRLLHNYTQETGATGDFWYNVVNRFMLSDGSLNGWSEFWNGLVGGAKAWNVDRGAKKIKGLEQELARAQAAVPLIAPPTTNQPVAAATTQPQNQPVPTMHSTVKAGFNTQKLLMIGGGAVALGALFYLLNKRKSKNAGLDEASPAEKYQVLPVI